MASRYFWGSSAVLLVVLLTACTAQDNTPRPTSSPISTFTPIATPVTTTTPIASPTATVTHTIADGTYNEKASYKSPAQMENVEFAISLQAGVITKVELLTKSSVITSEKFQNLFMDGIKKEVIGKKLADIGTFDRVNGSSLTPKAFNQAIEQLKKS